MEEVHLGLGHPQDPCQLVRLRAQLVQRWSARMARLASTLPSGKGGLQYTSRKKRRMSRCPWLAWQNSRQGCPAAGSRSPCPDGRTPGPAPAARQRRILSIRLEATPDLVLRDLAARLGDVYDGERWRGRRPPVAAGWGAAEKLMPHAPIRNGGYPEAEQGTEDVAEQKPKAPSTLPKYAWFKTS